MTKFKYFIIAAVTIIFSNCYADDRYLTSILNNTSYEVTFVEPLSTTLSAMRENMNNEVCPLFMGAPDCKKYIISSALANTDGDSLVIKGTYKDNDQSKNIGPVTILGLEDLDKIYLSHIISTSIKLFNNTNSKIELDINNDKKEIDQSVYINYEKDNNINLNDKFTIKHNN